MATAVASPFLSNLANQGSPASHSVIGSQLTREFGQNATSASDSDLSFQVYLSPNVLLDRCVMIEYQVDAVITVAAGIPHPDLSDFCLAQYPLHRVMRNCTVTLNNNSISFDPSSSKANALVKYKNEYMDQLSASTCPVQPASANNVFAEGHRSFADESIAAAITTYPNLNLMDNSPFKYFQQGGNREARASFLPISVARNNNTLVLSYKVTERLFHPAFEPVLERETYANLRNMKVQMSFLGNLTPMLTVGRIVTATAADPVVYASVVPTGVTCTIAQVIPRLLLRTYLPAVGIPASVSHPYSELVARNLFWRN